MRRFIYAILITLGVIISLSKVGAQELDTVTMKLIVGETDDTPTIGLIIDPKSGWKVYAPAPVGEETQGFQPEVDFTGSRNLEGLTPVWPLPEKYMDGDDLSYVYTKETLVPIHMEPINPDRPIHLKLNVRLLSCSTLCVPVEKTLELIMSPGEPEDRRVADALEDIEMSYEGTSLTMILLIALLGGFILNFMPCVLPVLSLKFMGFAQHRNTPITSTLLMTSAGILTSFLFLAVGAMALKASGEMVGWGIHFQNPYFLAILFLVVLIFAANMMGFYEFRLSSNLAGEASHLGQKTYFKDFFSGVFATLLATPCSAPFVGTSLSFALAREYSDIFLVFMGLGIGFASPYLIALLIPTHRFPLPKPGLWMVWLQRILGVGLLLTAVWLGFVLLAHVSGIVLFVMCVGAAFILLQLGVQHRLNWLTVFLILGTLSVIPIMGSEEKEFNMLPQLSNEGVCMSQWCEFDEQAIPHLVAQGYTVIVDVTSDWCVTCAVNKKLVFESSQVTAALTSPHVIAMRADWTKQNPKITSFLQKNSRFGIPFNIVFGPNAPTGIPLPEILTIPMVLEALEQASRAELD